MMVYSTIVLFVLIAFTSLAVDFGRAQLAKSELRAAVDAAARYGAQGFSTSTVVAKAKAAAAENRVDGRAFALQTADVELGVWRGNAFYSSGAGVSAVRVTGKLSNARGTAVPLVFAGIFGQKTVDLTVQAVATYTAPSSVTNVAYAKGNPWLSGMPTGTTANDFDSAPSASPTQVSGMTIVEGSALNFSFTGNASYLPGRTTNGPDGNLSRNIYNGWYTGYNTGHENGMSNLTAPIAGVVGVFLNDAQPNTQGALPEDLDFSTPESRDFSSLAPKLRQPFFIGDGLREDHTTVQTFIVPSGATRLFIGIMDGQQWSDNSGSFTTDVSRPMSISLVK
jgi:Flp pilus assembly protein TadG